MSDVGKDWLGGSCSSIATIMGLLHKGDYDVLGLITTDKTYVGTIKLIVIVAAARLGNLRRSGFA
jgi:hypothetical protein